MILTPTQPLAGLAEARSAHVHSIKTDNATRIRLLGMGIGSGTRIEVLRNRHGDIVLGNEIGRASCRERVSSPV